MIRSKRVNGYSDNAVLSEFYGLSTDTKPTENVATGSVFLEVDTGKTFLYDEEGEDWTEVESGSGGGGGGDSDFSTATITLIQSVNPDYGPASAIDTTFWPIVYNDEYKFINPPEALTVPCAFKIPLYNGQQSFNLREAPGFIFNPQLIAFNVDDEPEISGNIEFTEGGIFIITGDCEIALGSPK